MKAICSHIRCFVQRMSGHRRSRAGRLLKKLEVGHAGGLTPKSPWPVIFLITGHGWKGILEDVEMSLDTHGRWSRLSAFKKKKKKKSLGVCQQLGYFVPLSCYLDGLRFLRLLFRNVPLPTSPQEGARLRSRLEGRSNGTTLVGAGSPARGHPLLQTSGSRQPKDRQKQTAGNSQLLEDVGTSAVTHTRCTVLKKIITYQRKT